MADRDVLVPDPLSSDRQYARFCHFDLSEMQDREMTDELHCLWPQLWGLDSDHWLRERVRMLEAELSKRQGDSGHYFRAQLKPKLAEGVKL